MVSIIDCAAPVDHEPDRPIVFGIDELGTCPAVDPGRFDVLLTRHAAPLAPWVSAASPALAATRLAARVDSRPVAASILVDILRLNVDGVAGMTVESLGYSTLLGGGEFARWLANRSAAADDDASAPAPATGTLRVSRDGDRLGVVLDDPLTRNAMTAATRDALFDLLTNILDDPTLPTLTIEGAGRCFSTGGFLPEFGTSRDVALAHAIRTSRNCAALLHRLGDRATVTFHGAVIGSGLEVFAAAGRRRARAGTWFQLPELSMGLMPGAGGTVTVTNAVGRHRACWMMLSGRRIGAGTARRWGLIHEILA